MKTIAIKVNVMGMDLDRWLRIDNKKKVLCVADIDSPEKEDWATIYTVESIEKGKGNATALLKEVKKYYENKGKKFGGSVALNDVMSHIYKKLGIKEYK
jgi:hypothetical protein